MIDRQVDYWSGLKLFFLLSTSVQIQLMSGVFLKRPPPSKPPSLSGWLAGWLADEINFHVEEA
jgi:hypothetical protein